MRTSRVLLSVLMLAGGLFAQTNLDFRGYGDTATFLNWKGTQLFMSKPFALINGENKMLAFIYDDTVNAGRAVDSCVAEIGYEVGMPLYNLKGKLDTIWTNRIPLDTCNSLTAGKRYDPATGLASSQWTIDANDLPVRPHGAIDTTISTTSSGMFIPFSPPCAPYIRFYALGLAGSQSTTYIKAGFVFGQRQYVKVGN